MSMNSYFYNGYGFKIETLEAINGINFLMAHKNTLQKITQCNTEEALNIIKKTIEEKTEVENMDEYDFDKITELFDSIPYFNTEIEFDYDLWKVIAEAIGIVIAEETKISVETWFAQEDCEGHDCIMLTERMPWEFNENERKLTQMEFDMTMLKYIQELKLQTTCDRQSIEYFG